MWKLSYFVFVILASLIVVSNGLGHAAKAPIVAPSMAPSPSSDCSSILYENMVECFLFLVDDSSQTEPDASCCAGLESVVKINAECICEALTSSFQIGIPLNITKALTLPSACGMSSSSISNCGVNNALSGPAPAPAPGQSGPNPGSAPAEPPTAATTSPSPSSIDLTEGPAPSPKGGAHSISASLVLLLVSVLVVYFF